MKTQTPTDYTVLVRKLSVILTDGTPLAQREIRGVIDYLYRKTRRETKAKKKVSS